MIKKAYNGKNVFGGLILFSSSKVKTFFIVVLRHPSLISLQGGASRRVRRCDQPQNTLHLRSIREVTSARMAANYRQVVEGGVFS